MTNDWTDKLTLSNWQSLTMDEKRSQALAIGERIKASCAGVEEFKCGDQQHIVALFEKDDGRFALIPGGAVALGFDNRKPKLSKEQQQEWLESLLDIGAIDDGETINDYLLRILSAKRTVNLRPFLIELNAGSAQKYYDEADETDDESSCHDLIKNALSKVGMRLPSSDEWEWACSAGSQSIFRWGDDPDMRERGARKYKSGSLDPTPNAFGLHININSYRCECTDQEMLMRAGDGGTRECEGSYDSFITQASSYVEDISDSDAYPEYYETILVRRVIEI